MAIYHCNVSNVSRAKGSNSCATLSYISGQAVKDERLDKTFNYGRKERVEVTGTIIPDTAPREYKNPSILFNAIEKYETADNARTAKKMEVALPRELTTEQQQRIVEQFIRNNITAKGYACTYAIHTDKENNNPHAHILIANRQIDENGQWSSKRKMEYALDDKGQRVPIIDKETGQQKVDSRNRKQWKRINVEVNPLDKKETLQELREQWSVECNKYLATSQQIDHRSFAEQGKEQIPTIHEGYASRQIERRGGVSERCEYNREVSNINLEKQTITQSIADNQAFIEVLKETDRRLQDLRSIGTGAEEERRYNFAYDTVISAIERNKQVPVIHSQGKSVVVSEQDTPQKALSFLQATKEKWNEFVRELRESIRNARKGDLSKIDDKTIAEPKKTHISLLERIRGVVEDVQRKQAEKQEQKRRALEELERKEKERQSIIDKLNAPYYRHDTQQRLEKLEFVAMVYKESENDPVLQQKTFEKLGELQVIQTKEYNHDLQFWSDRRVWEVPREEVYSAISKARESIKAEIESKKRPSVMERVKEIQEQNKGRTIQKQVERTRTQSKNRGHER